jgi:endonuclease G
VLHNCTTLGGNSGSVVVDLKRGEALGLHFSGSFLRTNFAVRADRVKERLDALLAGTLRGKREVPARTRPSRRPASMTSVATGPPAAASRVAKNATSITIPLTVTVSLGGATLPASASASDARRPRGRTTGRHRRSGRDRGES